MLYYLWNAIEEPGRDGKNASKHACMDLRHGSHVSEDEKYEGDQGGKRCK